MNEETKDPQTAKPDATDPQTGEQAANENAPETEAAPEEAVEAAETATATEAEAEADPAAEVSDLKDKLLRAVAETENMRRRAERDKQDAAKFAVSNFARDVLSVADNLRRALDSVPEDQAGHEAVKTLMDGVQLTENELKAAMERHGIKVVDPQGEKFDHNFHQAMFEVPDTGQADGTVVQVIQVGYTIHDRLLRPAMVGVAKGAKPAPGSKDDDSGEHVDTVA